MNYSYLTKLIEDSKIAIKETPSKEKIIFYDGDVSCLDNVKDFNKGVYIIEEVNGNPSKTFKDFEDHKSKGLVAMPKANSPNNVMYVGSSQTNLKNRILQHLGYGYRKTYALHLKDWFKGHIKITIKEYNVSNEVLQLIEDNIGFSEKPAFGRRGPT